MRALRKFGVCFNLKLIITKLGIIFLNIYRCFLYFLTLCSQFIIHYTLGCFWIYESIKAENCVILKSKSVFKIPNSLLTEGFAPGIYYKMKKN